MRHITHISCIDPAKLETRIKEIAKEADITNFNNYDFCQIWEDSQGKTVSTHFIEDWKTKNRLTITFKNSWQSDIKAEKQRRLLINND